MPIVDTIDLKKETASTETGQTENTDETKEEVDNTQEETQEETTEETQETEDIESLPQWAQERLKKTEEDKENYKKGMLKYKDLTLKKEDTTTEETEDEDSTANLVKQQVHQEFEARNEKEAITKFVNDHPEVANKDVWGSIVENYTPRNGKDTVDSVIKDLNRALVLARYDSGEIDKLISEAEASGKKKGLAEAAVADLASVSKTSSKTSKQNPGLSQGALRLAEKFRVDPKKLAQEDDSNTAEIKL